MPSKRRMYHLLRLVTKAALWGRSPVWQAGSWKILSEKQTRWNETTPNSVSRTVGGLHREKFPQLLPEGDALEEPFHTGGQSVTALCPFLFFRVRSSGRFGKSRLGSNKAANCPVHRGISSTIGVERDT